MIGSFRTSSTTGARVRALLTFEVRAQAREPLTTLYALVFFLLAFGYAASSAVELVADRGRVPRTSSWALMLAFGGLTAFGQVITTMIATTAMLRDEAQRTREMIATTGVAPRTWFLARLGAAIVIMLAVYAAMPAGVLAGTWVRRLTAPADVVVGDGVGLVMLTALRAYAVITVPTVLVVSVVLAAAAVYTQRVLGVLIAALALVALWQGALSLVAIDSARTIGALLDPFGNAPVLALTAHWSEGERTMRTVPIDTLLLANRAVWLTVAALLVGLVLRYPARLFAPARAAVVTPNRGAAERLLRALARSDSVAASVRHFTAGWMALDGGWRIVSLLALLNATLNAFGVARSADATPDAVLSAVHAHARIFLILLATVYAGELVWRERDVRIDQVIGAIGASSRDLFRGRVLGILRAQLGVVGPLVVVGALLMLTVPRALPVGTVVLSWATWACFVLWLPFVQITVLSLLVHVLLDHKVGAHLLLITGWVVAVIIDRQGVAPWWLHFAEPATLLPVGSTGDAVSQAVHHMQRGAYWSLVSAAMLLCAYWRWPRGASGWSITSRR